MAPVQDEGAGVIDKAAALAVLAAPELAAWSGERRRQALHACADALAAAGDEVVAVAAEETGLTEARLRGELDRTTGQLRLLGDFVAAGRHRAARVSAGAAAGGVDVVAVAVPVGPVAVFAASNFPLAFGVAGGDTAAALAAGCPVVVKGHPAQPRTARLVAGLVAAALAGQGAPEGTFALVSGGVDASLELVRAAGIRAVGFTGSLAGGRALMDAAAARPDPIPVYAEMGSLNPVFVLPAAAGDPAWATAIAAAVTGSAGQLCTKPGLVVLPDSPAGRLLADRIAGEVAGADVGPRMLTERMAEAHAAWLAEAAELPGAVVDAGSGPVRPFAVRVPPETLGGALVEEHFGPAVVLTSAPVAGYPLLAAGLAGSLTATVVGAEADLDLARELVPLLAAVAGRIIWNGVPTGVAVCDAMHHGGPWPATSAPATTSVGTAAVSRFLRPVALQGVPDELVRAISPE
ncbi:aldehyde dehydrogenase family protein [Phytohabitans flavus]|uniref:aldehyde dehydrogenase family protein n=1 Tax=Phytohabitans flavus TaxID=1076124 RepID=UPI0015663DF1|nr:aldehyde dehydrogenase family protein [Phytohabitans flavus]